MAVVPTLCSDQHRWRHVATPLPTQAVYSLDFAACMSMHSKTWPVHWCEHASVLGCGGMTR